MQHSSGAVLSDAGAQGSLPGSDPPMALRSGAEKVRGVQIWRLRRQREQLLQLQGLHVHL